MAQHHYLLAQNVETVCVSSVANTHAHQMLSHTHDPVLMKKNLVHLTSLSESRQVGTLKTQKGLSILLLKKS